MEKRISPTESDFNIVKDCIKKLSELDKQFEQLPKTRSEIGKKKAYIYKIINILHKYGYGDHSPEEPKERMEFDHGIHDMARTNNSAEYLLRRLGYPAPEEYK